MLADVREGGRHRLRTLSTRCSRSFFSTPDTICNERLLRPAEDEEDGPLVMADGRLFKQFGEVGEAMIRLKIARYNVEKVAIVPFAWNNFKSTLFLLQCNTFPPKKTLMANRLQDWLERDVKKEISVLAGSDEASVVVKADNDPPDGSPPLVAGMVAQTWKKHVYAMKPLEYLWL